MSDFSITINDNGLSAQLILASNDSTPSKEDILKKCKDLKISNGIDIDLAIEQLESSSEPIIFAKCTKPKYEEDISFKWGVDLKDIYKPNIDANDNANYKDLNQFIPLAKDQKIVSINKPIVKESGIDIFGNKIDFLPVNAFFQVGNNITISEDKLSLVAKIDGCLFIKSGVLHVDDVYQIRGDVDFHTGNIDFNGDVIIGGDVKSGFQIISKGNIYVNGTVESSDLRSNEGSVFIKNGIQGKNNCSIKAQKGSVFTGYVQNASIECGSLFHAQNYVIDSKIESKGLVDLSGGDGIIRGSEVLSKIIKCNTIGSENSSSYSEVTFNNEKDINPKPISSNLIPFLDGIKDRLMLFPSIKPDEMEIIENRIANWKKTIETAFKETFDAPKAIVKKYLFKNINFNFNDLRFSSEKVYNNVEIILENQNFKIVER